MHPQLTHRKRSERIQSAMIRLPRFETTAHHALTFVAVLRGASCMCGVVYFCYVRCPSISICPESVLVNDCRFTLGSIASRFSTPRNFWRLSLAESRNTNAKQQAAHLGPQDVGGHRLRPDPNAVKVPGDEVKRRRCRERSGNRGAHENGVRAEQCDFSAFAIGEPAAQRHGPHPAEEEGGVEQRTEVGVPLCGEGAVSALDNAGRVVVVERAQLSCTVGFTEAQRGAQVELAGKGAARRPEPSRLQLVVALQTEGGVVLRDAPGRVGEDPGRTDGWRLVRMAALAR
jgi:hypothetical protein